MKYKIAFLGTPDFVGPVRKTIEENHTLVEEVEGADFLVVASFGKILPDDLLKTPRLASINIHPSLLPKYRGPSPIQSAILNGDLKTGVTLIHMDKKMDHGPVLAQEKLVISDKDTFQSLAEKAFELGAQMLIKILKQFEDGTIKEVEQDHESATFCKMIKKTNGFFDVNNPPTSEILDRMIRAYFPWPGVWTKWNGKVVKFLPGGLIQMEGKKAVPLKDFLNGYRDFPIKEI